MKSKGLLAELKDKISRILKQLNALKDRKRSEIREINKMEEKFTCLNQILASDIPVNDDTIPVFNAVSASGDFVSNQLSDLLGTAALSEQAFFATASTGSSAILTVTNTAATFNVYIPPEIKRKVLELTSGLREERKQEIINFLKGISPHLADIYLNANENLDIISVEPERGAAGLMREIVDQTLGILAKDNEIKKQTWFVPDPTSDSGITRAHRLKYIAETKSLNNKAKELIEENAELFKVTVKNLNESFHKRKQLDKEETKSFFYQAETLLKILSNSIKL